MVEMEDINGWFGTSYRKGKGHSDMHVLLWWQGSPPCDRGKAAWGWALLTVSQGVLVKEMLYHGRLRSPQRAQVVCVVTQFFDGFHLLIQVVSLNEVTQMRVFFSGQFV